MNKKIIINIALFSATSALGFISGVVAEKIKESKKRSLYSGTLKIVDDDNENPKIFLELNITVNDLSNMDSVLLNVKK